MQERIRATDDAQQPFDAHPEFELRVVDVAARSTSSALADTIIKASSDKIMQATGVHVDGALIGVAADGKAVQDLKNETLATYVSDDPNRRVNFVHNIELVPGLYYTSSVEDTRMLSEAIQANGDILKVSVTDRVEYDEDVAYTTEEVESDQYPKGTRRTTQKGKDGTRHVVADITTIDGVEVARAELGSEWVQEMVPRIITVGTKEVAGISYAGSSGIVGSGVLGFPVPGYSYITTQFGQGGHRGTDICAPYGTPIYACDGGTVVEAGYHWSWGNYVKIDHGNGMATLYAHCSALYVSAGQGVGRGQAIGTVGATGTASGNHCHLEVYVGGRLVNPMAYVS